MKASEKSGDVEEISIPPPLPRMPSLDEDEEQQARPLSQSTPRREEASERSSEILDLTAEGDDEQEEEEQQEVQHRQEKRASERRERKRKTTNGTCLTSMPSRKSRMDDTMDSVKKRSLARDIARDIASTALANFNRRRRTSVVGSLGGGTASLRTDRARNWSDGQAFIYIGTMGQRASSERASNSRRQLLERCNSLVTTWGNRRERGRPQTRSGRGASSVGMGRGVDGVGRGGGRTQTRGRGRSTVSQGRGMGQVQGRGVGQMRGVGVGRAAGRVVQGRGVGRGSAGRVVGPRPVGITVRGGQVSVWGRASGASGTDEEPIELQ